jgi:hypothetical protein
MTSRRIPVILLASSVPDAQNSAHPWCHRGEATHAPNVGAAVRTRHEVGALTDVSSALDENGGLMDFVAGSVTVMHPAVILSGAP